MEMKHPLTNPGTEAFRNDVAKSNPTLQGIVDHFEIKTDAILRRYGPGPRIHYHAGMVDDQPPARA